MEQEVTLKLNRADAAMLLRCLRHRNERLCDIRRELCGPEPCDELERQEAAFFEEESAVVERALVMLGKMLEIAPAD
jgi:hypothetical protein